MPIELYVITPADVLRAFLLGLVILAVAVAGTVWVMWPDRQADHDPATAPQTDPAEAVTTVEMEVPRRPQHGPRTGTIHAPQYQRVASDDPTVIIERVLR